MRVMIHACPEREWYVNEFLVPSLKEQGQNEVTVWMDRDKKGNLKSCIESFTHCSNYEGDTWHLQDDVIICRDFVERTRAAPAGLVCGFCVDIYEDDPFVEGKTTANYMWQSSFPCIKIPNKIAGEFAEWLIRDAPNRPELHRLLSQNKKDDTLFYIYMKENHKNMPIMNMVPHLVDHVDYLIGGSVINQWRGYIVRSCRWKDENLIEELEKKLASR